MVKDREEDLIRNETTTSAKTDAQIEKDSADDLTLNETSATAKTGAKKLRGAPMVKYRAEDLARSETTTGEKTGAQKYSRQRAKTCTTLSIRSTFQIAGPATSLPAIYGSILG